MASTHKKIIYNVLTKKHGLQLTGDAQKYLLDQLSSLSRDEVANTLDYIAHGYLQHQGDDKLIVDRDSLEEVVESTFRKANVNEAFAGEGSMDVDDEGQTSVAVGDVSEYFHVIDAFDIPRWRYKPDDKAFVKYASGSKIAEHGLEQTLTLLTVRRATDPPQLLAPASSRWAMFSDRYHLIRQRILRNDAFRAPSFANQNEYFHITPIKSLHGRKPGKYVLFGMLTQMEEGKYHLEDPDDYIELELNAKNLERGVGLFTMNCFILVEGMYTEDRTFRVLTLGMPLPEPREKSLSAFGNNVDFFGGPRETDDEVCVAFLVTVECAMALDTPGITKAVLSKIELGMTDVSLIIISDVWLDSPKVVMKLRELFEGFSNAVLPLAFIFMGNFTSTPYIYNSTDHQKYREGFNTLADVLSEFPTLLDQCHFIFVPGPHDPWSENVLPRPGIPNFFTGRLRNKVPKAHFASNPCRIKYCTQEIVVFREDLVNKMRRNAVLSPSGEDDVPVEQHLVATLLDQAHLSPLPLNVRPIYWGFDHALRLYPQPHVLILADRFDPYTLHYEGCQTINPGSFPNTEFTFMVYQPASGLCQESKL
ncbi:DNA polymerase epsilon subunit 2 [Rhizophlyctis rosea]|nr:DNA polymerase epsilon subunit 2 [Rhizophlyctis rosea]